MMKSILFSILFLVTSQASAGTIKFGDLLELTDLGVGVKPQAINNQGQVVGQIVAPDETSQAFLWQNNQITTLGTLGGMQGVANDINDNGVIVGSSTTDTGLEKAFSWNPGDTSLTNRDPLTSFSSSIESINIDNIGAGWKNNGSVSRSTMWNESSRFNGQVVFGGGNHQATGINDAGKVVGVTFDTENSLDAGYFWNALDPINDFSGGLDTDYFPLAGLNNNDLTAGRTANGLAALMSIDNSSSLPLDFLDPSDPISAALGLTNDTIVGESGMQGFAFDVATGEMMNINDFMMTGFDVEAVLSLTDINADGTFVGIANFNGVQHGIQGKAIIVPEPSGLSLITFGLSVFFPRKWVALVGLFRPTSVTKSPEASCLQVTLYTKKPLVAMQPC